MRIENWLNTASDNFKKMADGFMNKATRMAVTVLILCFAFYYTIEGFEKTVILEFRIPEGLQKKLEGVDSQTLTQQLIVDLTNIRAVQNSARTLDFNLVKGLGAVNPEVGDLKVKISGRINTDYRGLIDNLGSVQWGPFQVPAALLLKPFQSLIRQSIVQPLLQKYEDSYVVLATSDNGEAWQVTDQEVLLLGENSVERPGDWLSRSVRILSFKMAFLDGKKYLGSEVWIGYYHFHEGIRHLLDYFRQEDGLTEPRRLLLRKAIEDFHIALELNPSDEKAKINWLLARQEETLFLEHNIRAAAYRSLLEEIKALNEKMPSSNTKNLLIANYILHAESLPSENLNYSEAIQNYEHALYLLEGNSTLHAYLYNNMGLAYQKRGKLELAEKYFKKSLSYNKNYSRAYLNLGIVNWERKNYRTAENAFGVSIRKFPQYANAYYNLWWISHELQQDSALDKTVAACMNKQAILALQEYVSLKELQNIAGRLTQEETQKLRDSRSWLADQEATPDREKGGANHKFPFGGCFPQNSIKENFR